MSRARQAFTIVELLVVVAAVILLAGLALPGLVRAKELARRTTCLSSLRHLNLALNFYSEESDGFYPSRAPDRAWPAQLKPYASAEFMPICPSDSANSGQPARFADSDSSSYGLNGFGDPNLQRIEDESWAGYLNGPQRGSLLAAALAHPANTALFGETQEGALYVELKREPGSFIETLALARHEASKSGAGTLARRTGGANHAFADGSARYLPYGKALCPVNLWGITDFYRTNYALCLF